MRKNPNISNFHYRSETTNEDGSIETKWFYTLQEICEQYDTSTFTIYNIIKGKTNPRSPKLKNVKFYKDYKPAFIMVKNF